jgi:hypothetical protein
MNKHVGQFLACGSPLTAVRRGGSNAPHGPTITVSTRRLISCGVPGPRRPIADHAKGSQFRGVVPNHIT